MKYTNTLSPTSESVPRNLTTLEKPAISVQVLIFSINKGKLETVLINRIREPFKGFWSIPGDVIDIHESLDDAARRILFEKTGIHDVYLEQLYTFGDIDRDPRGRVVAVTYFALLPHNSVDLNDAPNSLHAHWTPLNKLPELAFDHREIIEAGVNRIRAKIEYSNIAHALLPDTFRLFELQRVHEIVLDKKFDKRNFRKKMNSLGLIEPTGQLYRSGNHRPAQLFRFITKELVHYD